MSGLKTEEEQTHEENSTMECFTTVLLAKYSEVIK